MKFDFSVLKSQKGAFLVLVAILIPVFLLLASLAVDLGKVWAYHSKLQNAADAAALAGAAHFNGGDQIKARIDSSNHSNADDSAKKYLQMNLGNQPFHARYLAQTVTDAVMNQSESYYRVEVTSSIPLTFANIIDIADFDVRAAAVARIPVQKSEAKGNMININGWIDGSVFDANSSDGDPGHIIYGPTFTKDSTFKVYDSRWYEEYKNGGPWGKWKTFTDEAIGKTRKKAIEDGNINYFLDGSSESYANETKHINNELNNLINSISNRQVISGNQDVWLPTADKDLYIVSGDSTQNLTIHLRNINGVESQPVYLYIKNNYDMIKILLEDNIVRPIIICYTGHAKWWSGATNFQFEGQNHNFTGSIYAPDSQIMPFNFDSGTFRGSITADAIQFQSNHGKFIYKTFGSPVDSMGGGGNSSGTVSSGPVQLVENDKVSWK